MSFNYFSKLPVWARPLPSLVLLCAFAALGYGVQQQPSAALTAMTSQPGATNDHSPFMSAPGQGMQFAAPGTSADNPAMTSGASPSLGLEDNSTPTLNKRLTLSKDGSAGAALDKFRHSPLAKSFGKALADQKEGRTAEAIKGYRRVLHQMPNALPAHLNLAVAYLQAGQPAKAIPHLQAIVKVDPKNVSVQFELAKVLLNQKRLQDAKTPLRQVVKLMPQNPQPRVLLAQLYYSQKDYQQAFEQWTALDEIDDTHGKAAYTAGVIAAQNLKAPQKALPWLRKAHRLAPKNDNATLLLGQVLATTGDTKEAEPLLAEMTKKDPNNVGIWRVLADVQWKNKHHDAAISSLQKVIALDPGNKETKSSLAKALSARAESQTKSGNLTAASNTWKQVQQLYPDNQLPRVKRAELMRKLGRDDDAKQLYQQVLQATPKDPNALLGVASIAMKNKDYSNAYDHLWRAIQVQPNFSPAYEAFVGAAVKTHQEKDAYLLLQGWLKKHPNLTPAQKAFQALTPAANKLPELTPLPPDTGTPDIKTDSPPTLTLPPKPKPKPKPVKPAVPPVKAPAPAKDKPQMTPTGANSARSRISTLKPITPKPTAPKPAPEATVPE